MRESKQIESLEQLEEALRGPAFLLFKHSKRCPASTMVFEEYQAFSEANPEVPTGWIDVNAQRDLSRWVAEETGITHQSPQALYYRAGDVIWHGSHSKVTLETLTEAVQE